MDFIDKKNELVKTLEKYINNEITKDELIEYIQNIEKDDNFRGKQLFEKLFEELKLYINDLSKKEIKQRILIINDYID